TRFSVRNRTMNRTAHTKATRPLEDWFVQQGWSPFKFQRDAWRSFLEGRSGLIHAATGTGKTYAAWLAPIGEWLAENEPLKSGEPGLQVLWITPLRALAEDTLKSLRRPIEEMGLPWSVEKRTGDTPAAKKLRQR